MELNLADLFESVADAIPERMVLVSGSTGHTFADLDRRATQLAHALSARGIRAGDHVGLFLYNGHEFVEAMLAAFKIRAVPVNINYRYVEEELAYLFTNADLVAVFSQRELFPRVEAIRDRVPLLRTVVVVEDGSGPPGGRGDALDYESLLASGSPERTFGPR